MAQDLVRIIYDTATLHVNQMVLEDDDSFLAYHMPGDGESFLDMPRDVFYNLGSIQGIPDINSVSAYLFDHV